MFQLFWKTDNSLSKNLSIFIKSNTGKTVSVNLDPAWDIGDVKKIVGPKLGLKPDEIKIIFAGKELGDTVKIEQCDLGQRSTLHAVKNRNKREKNSQFQNSLSPLCETLKNESFSDNSTYDTSELKEENKDSKAHFYIFCATCKGLRNGKLRVRCFSCKKGALTLHRDPKNWDDVLEPQKITGQCEFGDCESNASENKTYAEFFFKCSEHVSLGEQDGAVPLYLIRPNLQEVPCLACGEVGETAFVFPCLERHVSCLDCFSQFCKVKLQERQFWQHPDYGYTLSCPIGCPDSFIKEIHHFRLLSEVDYAQYQRFGTEEYVLRSGGVLCPQPNCGMGILIDEYCTKVICGECKYVFCSKCLQGYHVGDCDATDKDNENASLSNCSYNVDPSKAANSRWDEASKIAIKVLTKPCPKCRTPTERDGGCMHMVCTRAGCDFHWCWICQTPWTRECMGNHWFG